MICVYLADDLNLLLEAGVEDLSSNERNVYFARPVTG